jgi:hypothetical protein
LLAGALRAGRREEGDGAGGTTNVLASTASGDVQPSAWLAAWVAAAIKSGAGVTLPGSSAAAPSDRVDGPLSTGCEAGDMGKAA